MGLISDHFFPAVLRLVYERGKVRRRAAPLGACAPRGEVLFGASHLTPRVARGRP